MPFALVKVTKLIPLGETMVAEVSWGNEGIPKRVNVANWSRVSERGIADKQ